MVIYTSQSRLRHPVRLLGQMAADLKRSRELAWRLLVRNIKAQYRQTVLGYLWAFLPPILMTVTFVFLNSQKIINIQSTKIPYPVYVLIGTLLWQGFVDALNSQIRLVTQSKSMLIKINFPREALILAATGEVLFNFFIRLLLFGAVFVWFKIPLQPAILLAPLGIFSIILFGVMIGVTLTPLAILYKDIERGLLLITSLWFFLTPVVYPPPSSWPASVLAKCNPVSPLIICTREWITTGMPADNIISFICVTLVTLVALCIGWVLYKLAMPHLIARIGS